MILAQKILFLRNVPLFSGLAPGELGQLAEIAEEAVCSAGMSIIVQGEHGDSMFLIVEGEVAIHNEEKRLAILKARDYFGEMSILDGEPRSASATAHTDCLLLQIRQADFHRMLSQHFQVALAIIQTLTRRLRQVSAGSSKTLEEKNPDEQKQS